MKAREPFNKVDVLICGGGPVGLLIGYCLERYGVSTHILEQREREEQARYGRAAMIAPRTLEILDQLDLADALGQIGFVVRGQASYKNGQRVENITAASSNIKDTFFDYLLLCRQRYTEDIIQDGYRKYSQKGVQYGARLIDFSLDHEQDFAVNATIEIRTSSHLKIKSRYIIGADGGRSTIREIGGIPFEGESSGRCWVRIDGVVETDMPEARRGICGLESPSHGSILWACLDHGATRIGFALPEAVWDRHGPKMTEDDVISEAQKALEPFTLQFNTVDWWTIYSVGQRLAQHYRTNERIFLAGDAAHTHSSGGAQGMNTGLHDAVNLSWKLAGRINGWLADPVVDSYESERRPIAEKIIDQDKIIAVLTGGKIPDQFKDDADADPHQLLTATYKENAALNTGLGIEYPCDGLTVIPSNAGVKLKVFTGQRAPDVLLQRPGLRVPVRLYSIVKSDGKFSAIVFCGKPSETRVRLKEREVNLDRSSLSTSWSENICSELAIIQGDNEAGSATELLGISSFDQTLYDVDGSAHDRYGVSSDTGAIIILRPDGTVGSICDVEDVKAMSMYFNRFNVSPGRGGLNKGQTCDGKKALAKGEIDVEIGAGKEAATKMMT